MPTFNINRKPITDSKLLLQDSYKDDGLAIDFTEFESKTAIVPDLEKVEKIRRPKKKEIFKIEKTAHNDHIYDPFFRYESNLSKKLNLIMIFIMLIFGFNIFMLTKPSQNLSQLYQEDRAIGGVSSGLLKNGNESLKVNNNIIFDNNSTKTIDTFQNNPALVDLGFKVDIGKNYIANFDDPNCQTPIVPPSVNGCGFAVLLSGLGVPDKGISFKSLNIEANFKGQDNKIQIDQKNYEKGTFTKTLGILSPQSTNNKIILPSVIPSSDTLYFRFWIKSGTVSISKISVDYYIIDDLKKVGLSFENPLEDKLKTGFIYQDVDENTKYDNSIDKRWVCQANFSGVLPVKIEKTANITLKRDDTCYTFIQPEKWKDDDKLLVLPPGKWLLVFDGGSSYSFEIKNDSENFDIKLKN